MNQVDASARDREVGVATPLDPMLSELARTGTEMLERRVFPLLGSEDRGKFVALDVGTGEFEVDRRDFMAARRLRDRLPGATIWLGRVGHVTAYQIGRG